MTTLKDILRSFAKEVVALKEVYTEDPELTDWDDDLEDLMKAYLGE